MNADLKDFLLAKTGPDMYDVFRDAVESLQKMNAADIDDAAINIIMVDDSVDEGESVNKLHELISTAQRELLAGHGVIVSGDARMQTLSTYINAIANIDSYDNPEELIQTASLNFGPQECLAEVMSLVSGEAVETLMVDLQSVDPSLIAAIRKMANKSEETRMSVEERGEQEMRVHALVVFCNYVDNHELRVNQMLANGVGVGYPFLVYANMVGRDLEAMPTERAAEELIAMALISIDGYHNPRAMINSNIEQFVADIDTITRITVRSNDILLRMKL